MPEAPTITLGSAGSHLAIRVLRRLYPQRTDYWDGNWVACEVHVRAGAFSGAVQAGLRTDELARFAGQLGALCNGMAEEAVLASMEEWLQIRVKIEGHGRWSAECSLNDKPGMGNELRFQLHFDQTDVPPVLSTLRHTLDLFPVRGHPDE